jgi:AcrR family transcriptional regulator
MFTMLTRMPDVNTGSAAGPTRRERVRAQTRAEILAAARQLVAQGEGLSLRAVAREVGMTPPALYRYVEGHDDLLDLVGGALYDELIGALTQARDEVDPDDLPMRLTVMSHAFRRWALDHRHEYALLFANPLDTLHAEEHEHGSTHDGATRFGGMFAEVFAALWDSGRLPEPPLDSIDPALLAMLAASDKSPMPLPLPVRYLYVRQWSRLYGMVTLEAFGHLHWALEDSGSLFEAMLDDCADELGFGEQRRAARAALRQV